MCVIAISQKGIRQPSETELKQMWEHNPHGGGYMFNRNGYVEIHKGFMVWDDFIRAVKSEHFGKADSVVYHFRISTQGGINAEMTHPFPFSEKLSDMKALDVLCGLGIAHNGIIPMTTDRTQTEYSDTALFIVKYLTQIINYEEDIFREEKQTIIEQLIQSKMAIMDSNGNVVTIGKFFDRDGILLSKEYHIPIQKTDYKFNYVWKGDTKGCIAY